MYVTASYGYRGFKITTMRAYTNEEELANFIRRCRRTAIQQAERSVEQHLEREQRLQQPLSQEETRQLRDRFVNPNELQRQLESVRHFLQHAERTLATFRNGTLEEFILTRNHPTVYFCEDNPVDPLDSGTRQNQKLGPRQLVERLRNANVRLDDHVGDIPLPEDYH